MGAGFHPELSGRENVYLNGVILGMRRAEIARRFDEIVAFSGVEAFLDMAVKHYSTGMYMRLAFALAVHVDSDILLLDEVLAVGDEAFGQQCLAKLEAAAARGTTILFVAHDMELVSRLCSRALLLRDGLIAAQGPVAGVVAQYRLGES